MTGVEQYYKRLGSASEMLQNAERLAFGDLVNVTGGLIMEKAEARAKDMNEDTKMLEAGLKSGIASSPLQFLRLGEAASEVIKKKDKTGELWAVRLLLSSLSHLPDKMKEGAAESIQADYNKANQLRYLAKRRIKELTSLAPKDGRNLLRRLWCQDPIEEILADETWPNLQNYVPGSFGNQAIK